MMYLSLFVLGIFIFFIYIKKNKLHIQFHTFLEEGFIKLDNSFGISLYCGKQGTGKTYSAVSFVESQRKAFNYVIISNLKSYCDLNNAVTLDFYRECIKQNLDISNIQYIYEPNILKIIEFCSTFRENERKILIFFDEIFTVLENQGSIRREVRSFLSQLRKRNIIFVTTAQEWAEIHISFRRYVRFQISCSMKTIPFSKKAIVFNQINDGDLIHWDEQSQDFVAPVIQTNISKGLKRIIDLYDTFETIDNTELLNKSYK